MHERRGLLMRFVERRSNNQRDSRIYFEGCSLLAAPPHVSSRESLAYHPLPVFLAYSATRLPNKRAVSRSPGSGPSSGAPSDGDWASAPPKPASQLTSLRVED